MPTFLHLGEVTVVALDDGEGPFFEPRETSFPDATAEQWRAADARDPSAVRGGGWWLHFRCFAFRWDHGRTILVDAGIGGADAPAKEWAPVPGCLPGELAAAGISRDEVDTVVLTHAHTDHIGWSVHPDGTPYFPRARYVLQRAEVEALDERGGLARWLLDPLRDAGQLSIVDDDASIAPRLRLRLTPGHTPGHQVVLLDTMASTLVATGDVLLHAIQLIWPELTYAHDGDARGARESRRALLDELAGRGRVTLATAHLGEPFVTLPAPAPQGT